MASKSNVTENWPRWKVALAVGAPVALGLAGVWYYKRSRGKKSESAEEQKTKDAVSTPKEELPQTPLERAQAAKNKGNKYFKGGKYNQAIDCYTEAIEVCPKEQKQDLATFFQNRAAAFEQLKKYDNVVKDCTQALEYNKKYTKALFRRAKACEISNDLVTALEDITAVCILESFSNQQSLMMADRVLKELGSKKAKESYPERTPVEPSVQFVRTYFSAFANDPIVHKDYTEAPVIENDIGAQGDGVEKEQVEENEKELKTSPFLDAKKAFLNKEYKDIIKLCSEEISLANSSFLAESLLLRGTFYLMRGEGNKATKDLNKLIELADVDKTLKSNALIKMGSLKLQNNQKDESLADFAKAIELDPQNSDVFHHRGQVYLLIDKLDDALQDFEKSVTINPSFPITTVQKCYTEYRQAFTRQSPMQLQSAMKNFKEALAKFPDCAEGFALYGQALCDQQNFEEADGSFKRAIEIEKDNGTVYVHRGLLQLQWKQNVETAMELIKKALEVDDKCEFAYETLGTLEVQRGGLDKAIGLFQKALELAKTEMEMAHLHSLLEAAKAQLNVAKRFGVHVPLGDMGMM